MLSEYKKAKLSVDLSIFIYLSSLNLGGRWDLGHVGIVNFTVYTPGAEGNVKAC